MAKQNPTAHEIIVPGDEDQLHRRREEWCKTIEQEREERLDASIIDASIKRKLEEVDALMLEVKKDREDRRRFHNNADKATKAREFLRHNPPQWMRARQEQITVALARLREEFAPQLLREAWLQDKLRGLVDSDRVARRELQRKLDGVQAELAVFQQRYAELFEERSALVKRAITEAWPEPPAEAPPKRRRAEAEAVA